MYFLPYNYLCTVVFYCLTACTAETQSPVDYIPLETLAALPSQLNETSGLASASDSTVYVHNDSGNKSNLYEISLHTGDIVRTIEIDNAKNKDWEELTEDSLFIYIGDFGNNSGSRDDLRILRIEKSQLQSEKKIDAEKIRFSYPDQDNFMPRRKHDFDCEAMIAYGDSLYLFSKNRASFTTDVYRLPKEEGEYVAEKITSFNTHGLITAADFAQDDQNSLVLLGYSLKSNRYVCFLWEFRDFEGVDFFGGTARRFDVAPNLQAESILWESDTTVIITNEEERGGAGQISRLTLTEPKG